MGRRFVTAAPSCTRQLKSSCILVPSVREHWMAPSKVWGLEVLAPQRGTVLAPCAKLPRSTRQGAASGDGRQLNGHDCPTGPCIRHTKLARTKAVTQRQLGRQLQVAGRVHIVLDPRVRGKSLSPFSSFNLAKTRCPLLPLMPPPSAPSTRPSDGGDPAS